MDISTSLLIEHPVREACLASIFERNLNVVAADLLKPADNFNLLSEAGMIRIPDPRR
jgi:hypothetical protein